MPAIRVLKIGSDGIPLEHNNTTDEIEFASFSVTAGGPTMGASGIDLNNQDVSDVNDLVFNDPTTGTINQTAGALVVDNIMAKDRENTMTVAGSVAFPVITDVAGQVDAFRLPALAGVPSASPTNGGEGHLVWNSSTDTLYAWSGSAWKDLSIVEDAERVTNIYTAEVAIAARDVVYISSADNVSPASASSPSTSYAIGLAKASAAASASVDVVSEGVLSGFSGLTAGSRYYLSASTPGAITSSIPTGTGNTIILCGLAKSATELHVRIEELGRRG